MIALGSPAKAALACCGAQAAREALDTVTLAGTAAVAVALSLLVLVAACVTVLTAVEALFPRK